MHQYIDVCLYATTWPHDATRAGLVSDYLESCSFNLLLFVNRSRGHSTSSEKASQRSSLHGRSMIAQRNRSPSSTTIAIVPSWLLSDRIDNLRNYIITQRLSPDRLVHCYHAGVQLPNPSPPMGLLALQGITPAAQIAHSTCNAITAPHMRLQPV